MESPRLITLRRDDTCLQCGTAVGAGTRAWWDGSAKTVTCADCHHTGDAPAPPTSESTNTAVAGASARREGERRKTAREDRVRRAHPKIGGFLLAVTDEPQSTAAWGKGAKGEEKVGGILDRYAEQHRLRVLHDRRIPGSRANIDHIVVTKFGVMVVDTKNYTGQVEQRSSGSLLRRGEPKLYVGGRDRTTLFVSVRKQIEVVTRAAGSLPVTYGFTVTGALCFWNADFPLLAKPYTFDDIDVHWPRSLAKAALGDGAMSVDQMDEITRTLAQTLRPA